MDDVTADRLLSGRLAPADAPPGYAQVARLAQAATGPAAPSELAGESLVLPAAMAVLGAGGGGVVAGGRSDLRRRLRTTSLGARVAALSAGIVLVGATAAAAANGSLPRPAQSAIAEAASHLGISVPDPDKSAASVSAPAATSTPTKPSVASTGAATSGRPTAGDHAGPNDVNATFGQCTAFLAHTAAAADRSSTADGRGPSGSTAFIDLVADHGGTVTSTTAFCRGVVASHDSNTAAPGTGNDHSQSSGNSNPSGKTDTPGQPNHSGGGPSTDTRSSTDGQSSGDGGTHSTTGSSAAGSRDSGGSSTRP